MLLVITVFRVCMGRNTIKIRPGKGTEEHEATSLHKSPQYTFRYVFLHNVLKVLSQKNIKMWG